MRYRIHRQHMGSLGIALVSLGLGACGGSKNEAVSAEATVEGQRTDDQSRCEYKGRDDRDVQESSAPGAVLPNVRRVYGYIGTGGDRRRVLLCREVDTNFDGVKDLLRTYGDNAEKLTEQADSDYDGRIDTWITFGKTRPAKIEVDKSGDGQPDEVRFYTDGKLSRVQRDTNADGKADVFEVYREGRLERMGVDANFDGQVDVWHRDEERAREEEAEEASAQNTEGDSDSEGTQG